MLMAKIPLEDHIAVSAAASAAVLASATEVEGRSAPARGPIEEYAPQVLLDTIISCRK